MLKFGFIYNKKNNFFKNYFQYFCIAILSFFFFFFSCFGTKAPNKPLLNLVTSAFTPKDHERVLNSWIILFNKFSGKSKKKEKG
jgi:hypothetical protein